MIHGTTCRIWEGALDRCHQALIAPFPIMFFAFCGIATDAHQMLLRSNAFREFCLSKRLKFVSTLGMSNIRIGIASEF
jgi:hypothetical protein